MSHIQYRLNATSIQEKWKIYYEGGRYTGHVRCPGIGI